MSTWLRSNKLLCIIAGILLLGLLALGFVLAQPQCMFSTQGFHWTFLQVTPNPTYTLTSSPTPPIKKQTAVPTATPTATLSSAPTATKTPTITPTLTTITTRVLSVPVILQELPLSCEFAGMRMVLAAVLGTAPSEKELIDCMPRDSNPNLGFRGDPAGYNRFADGATNWDNYGVYAPAVAETLNQCVLQPAGNKFRAVAITGTTHEQVANSVLDGYPVIVWVTKRQQAETMRVDTPQGAVQLVLGEHVWVVVGYHEDGTFDVHDPYPQRNGVQTFRVRSFPNWDLFDRMAVFIQVTSPDTRYSPLALPCTALPIR